ncbi:hypothetical protein BJ165DRAFT_416204 [Panaeolus papilionaceus]|nr:hypothetical protein BJ165DRAFT_416204 [Panaeolus papilionaceus]
MPGFLADDEVVESRSSPIHSHVFIRLKFIIYLVFVLLLVMLSSHRRWSQSPLAFEMGDPSCLRSVASTLASITSAVNNRLAITLLIPSFCLVLSLCSMSAPPFLRFSTSSSRSCLSSTHVALCSHYHYPLHLDLYFSQLLPFTYIYHRSSLHLFAIFTLLRSSFIVPCFLCACSYTGPFFSQLPPSVPSSLIS